MNNLAIDNYNLHDLTSKELADVSAGGFFREVGAFLAAWYGFVDDYSSSGANPMVLMGGA